jgi:hypothetical protein
LRLYDILEGKRKALKPTPPRPSFAELGLPIVLAGGSTLQMCEDSVEGDCLGENTDVGEAGYESTAEGIQASPGEDDSSAIFENPTEMSEKPSQVLAAERWATKWRESLPKPRMPRITKSYLRAYSLWHHSGLSVGDIANVLRDPPLQSSTVTNYILESIRLERLPYDEVRVRDVLKNMPDSIVKTRYRSIKVVE